MMQTDTVMVQGSEIVTQWTATEAEIVMTTVVETTIEVIVHTAFFAFFGGEGKHSLMLASLSETITYPKNQLCCATAPSSYQ